MKLVHTVAAALGVGFICAVPFTIEATPPSGISFTPIGRATVPAFDVRRRFRIPDEDTAAREVKHRQKRQKRGQIWKLELEATQPIDVATKVVTFQPQAVEEWGPWNTPVNAGEPLNTPYNDMYAVLTRSQLIVYFTSDRPGGLGGDDLWRSTRASVDSPWDPPENLAALNSPYADSLPMLTTSGNVMYFFSDRPGGCGVGDLWQAQRHPSTGIWGPPVNLGCVVNTIDVENAPAFYASDDLGFATLYFGSNRPGGIGDFDVYQTTTTDDDLFNATWTPGVLVPELSSPGRDTRTFVRFDGLEIFITSDRAGGTGGLDIWTATRESTSDPWSTPVNLGTPINSLAAEGSPTLTQRGNTMYFFSTRAGGYGGRDIWISTR